VNNNTINTNTNITNTTNNDKSKPVTNSINGFKLKFKSHVGEGQFKPNETRQCGWMVANNTKSKLNMKGHLQKIGGDEKIKITTEKSYEFELLPNEDTYLLCDVVAPNIVGKYCLFYQFVSQDGSLGSDILEIIIDVKSQFPKKQRRYY